MVSWKSVLIVIGAGILGYFFIQFLIGYLEKPKNRKTAIFIDVMGVVFLVAALAGGYFYFFIFYPTFIEKPYMEKPYLYVSNASTEEEVINEQHIAYLVNEMGGYRLHDDPLSKTPAEFEFYITDFNRTYTVGVNENNVIAWDGGSAKPDGRIYGKQETVILLFQSTNLQKDLVKFVKEGKLRAEILADETTLALKGYRALYEGFK